MSTAPLDAPAPVVTEADRAWAREQIAKAPMPQDLVDYINELRRTAATQNTAALAVPSAAQ